MKRVITYIIVSAFVGYFVFYILLYNAFIKDTPALSVFNETVQEFPTNKYKIAEEKVFKFIDKKLIGENGEVYSNTKTGKGNKDTLSESIGLLMNYSLISDRKELFNKEFAYLQKNMLVKEKYIKWESRDEITCNSLIDDLRIIRALLEAYDKWSDEVYFNSAGFLQESVYKSQVSSGKLYELYDWKYNAARNVIPLSYSDFYSLGKLQSFNENWRIVAENALRVVKNGLFKKTSPFYYKYYNYENESYKADEEMNNNNEICLTYTLYTALHLAESNENTDSLTSWIKKEIKKGRLYAWYNPNTLKPSRKMESTAVYALSALYADKVGEKELAKDLVDKMMKFMVKNKKSPYYGGYGDEKTGNFYSFDNLTALWALSVMAEK